MTQTSAVFLDRDGTIIEDTHYIRDPKEVRLLPNAVAGLKAISAKGYLLFVVSNQSGVGRGIISSEEFWAVHQKVGELLLAESVSIAEFLYCFHTPEDACRCRKPQAGLIPKRFADRELALKASFTVGDKPCDLELADNIGAKGILVLTGKGADTREKLIKSGRLAQYSACANLLEVAAALPSPKN